MLTRSLLLYTVACSHCVYVLAVSLGSFFVYHIDFWTRLSTWFTWNIENKSWELLYIQFFEYGKSAYIYNLEVLVIYFHAWKLFTR